MEFLAPVAMEQLSARVRCARNTSSVRVVIESDHRAQGTERTAACRFLEWQ